MFLIFCAKLLIEISCLLPTFNSVSLYSCFLIKKAMAETAAAQEKRPTRRLKDIANIGNGQSVIGLTKKR